MPKFDKRCLANNTSKRVTAATDANSTFKSFDHFVKSLDASLIKNKLFHM